MLWALFQHKTSILSKEGKAKTDEAIKIESKEQENIFNCKVKNKSTINSTSQNIQVKIESTKNLKFENIEIDVEIKTRSASKEIKEKPFNENNV